MKIAQSHGGAFLCDGVGLGKTFVGLMLIERLVLHENKRVVLFAPKAAREGVWEPHLRDWLPHIGGVGGRSVFSNLEVLSHTDLHRGGDFPDRLDQIAELADAVIVDEAHHFRNRGSRGDQSSNGSGSDGLDHRSRYWRLYDLLDSELRSKLVFLLTATPVNNRLADFRHMAELFTRGDEAYFARRLGVNNLSAHFNVMERHLTESLNEGLTAEAQEVLANDEVFSSLVVQRSRAYAKASQIAEGNEGTAFPDRKPPRVAEYSIRSSYGGLLDMFTEAFEKENPLFSLAIYYPLGFYTGPDGSIDPLEEGRQRQVVGLIRTLFLKRFESSAYAFQKSLDLLMRKLLAFVEVHSETGAERDHFESWKRRHAEVIGYRPEHQLSLDLDDDGEEIAEEDVVPPELLEAVTDLSRHEYDVPKILNETFADLDQIVRFIDLVSRLEPAQDDKLKKLVRLLRTKDLAARKVLVFTEFADTARYVESHLRDAGIDGVARIDGGSTVNRAEVIRRFSPYYNGSSSPGLASRGDTEIRVLVSTDVLSEGLNLQDATRLINYDLHWNPVRLMQRIGRVDRLFLTTLTSTKLGQGPALTVTPYVPDLDHFSGRGAKNVMPLYRDPKGQKPNVPDGLLAKLGHQLETETSAEDLLAYVHALAGTAAFTERFEDELSEAAGPIHLPITADPALFRQAVEFGSDLLWWHTWGERFAPTGQTHLPPGQAKQITPVEGMPEKFGYDPGQQLLTVGTGAFGPVSTAVWNFEVSGLKVVNSWLAYRMKKRKGRKSSPLDHIRPTRWTQTDELLRLLAILEHTIDVTPTAAALLDEILANPLIPATDLPKPTADQRRPAASTSESTISAEGPIRQPRSSVSSSVSE